MADSKDLQKVRYVLRRHREQIIKKYQAEGVGIGKNDPKDEKHVITVYLRTGLNMPKESVTIEDVPLKFEITGKFKLKFLL